MEGPFAELYGAFWEQYLSLVDDPELTAVIQPWFAWRTLVLASPQWYPTLGDPARRKLFNFAHRLLQEERFEWQEINRYLER
mgnify:FL=1